ncbi:hypothetical protein LMJ53_06410 [Rheinheimera sp. UJ51]|uniref:hypothetical protein n=1 Tax=Rheinheimera sp. UJ51 TaxID=2892446 RepID=UPI001E2B0904|nr:hypothetical protein [Rheinheimera sp. UJ51]MCC5451365.1 hypothetical protein [Rheinheimera sp. UJ51]
MMLFQHDTLLLIYLMPLLGFILGMLPALVVWRFSKPRRKKHQRLNKLHGSKPDLHCRCSGFGVR